MHPTFRTVLAERLQANRTLDRRRDEDDATAAEVLEQQAATDLVQLGTPQAASASPDLASSSGAVQPHSDSRTRTRGSSLTPQRGQAAATAAGSKVSKVVVHRGGSSRRSSRWIKSTGGIPRMLPNTNLPVSTQAEKLLFMELLPECKQRDGGGGLQGHEDRLQHPLHVAAR